MPVRYMHWRCCVGKDVAGADLWSSHFFLAPIYAIRGQKRVKNRRAMVKQLSRLYCCCESEFAEIGRTDAGNVQPVAVLTKAGRFCFTLDSVLGKRRPKARYWFSIPFRPGTRIPVSRDSKPHLKNEDANHSAIRSARTTNLFGAAPTK